MKNLNELARTLILIAVAVVLAGAAWILRPKPMQLDTFNDQGEVFYPNFTDPLAAASLEVIDFDADTGAAVPFKVQVKNGRWTIPSHFDYPADGEDRLANTASGIIALRKDVIQTDRAKDFENLGVIDPLDETNTTLKGRGKRIVLRDESSGVLADFIIGSAVPGKEGFRYVRLPDKKRVYGVKIDVDLSTKFADWIETNLLDVQSNQITQATIQDYSVNEQSGRVDVVGTVWLEKDRESSQWHLAEVPEGKKLDPSKVTEMTGALSRITITGVRPKPEGLTSDLRTAQGLSIDLPTQLSLQSKGFFLSPDGRLLSNEGEVSFGTTAGVRYTLRFGEILYGEGLAVSAGEGEDASTNSDSEDASGPENRYLFVTAQFDESLLGEKPVSPTAQGTDTDVASESDNSAAAEGNVDQTATEEPAQDAAQVEYESQVKAWQSKVDAAKMRVQELNDRFAPWYYVISASDFSKIRLNLDKLVIDTPADTTEES